MKKIFALQLFLLFSCIVHAQTDSGYFKSFDNTKIYYEVKGNGIPVLLIHGFTGTGNDWKNKMLFDSLLSNGFKVITVDLRGNGKSDKPKLPEAYANDAEAKDLVGLMQFLVADKYYALGYSRGSIILARVLVKDKNCKRAVIGGMGADFTDPQWPRRIGFYNALMNDTIKGYEGFRKYIAGKGLDPLILAYQQKEQPATSKEELSALTQPVLIICGNEDTDNGKGSDLQLLIPNSKFIAVPGDHNNTAYSAAFEKEALNFLKEQ
ncbi:MAG: alpha/beta fold hydrolase [Bacteroidota bacterium]